MNNVHYKFSSYKFFILLSLIIVSFYAKNIYAITHHYIDIHGNSLDKFDFVWEQLNPIFDKKCPQTINIDYSDNPHSTYFEINKNLIIVNMRDYHGNFPQLLAHDTTHLCLAKITNDASKLNEFRFIDEGYAMLLATKVAKKSDLYKYLALRNAIRENQKEEINFKFIQDWDSYCYRNNINDPSKWNYDAYNVGSSFLFYLQDTYSEDVVNKLLRSIGKTKNLEESLQVLLNKSLLEVEKEWKVYLATYKKKHNVALTAAKPRIVDIYPKHNAIDVPSSIKELYVKFNVPMLTNYLTIGTYYPEVSYKNAYWKDDKTLVIKIKQKLQKDFTYKVTLGKLWQGSTFLFSKEGINFPVTDWIFTTKK